MMRKKEVNITYAQYHEDLILDALLDGVDEGFYIDVGANHPVNDSVTKLFYDKGWSGVNIEPIPRLHRLFVKQRKRDINLCIGVGSRNETMQFKEYEGLEGHSTFINKKDVEKVSGVKINEYPVKVKRLEDVLEEMPVKKIHFLKIDVEGFEKEVLKGNNWNKFRPEVICIESNHITEDWSYILTDARYQKVINDGLNEYYLADESLWRYPGYAERVVAKSNIALRKHQYDVVRHLEATVKSMEIAIEHLKTVVQSRDAYIANQELKIEKLEKLSLYGKGMRARLKISAIGLTTDWLRMKRATAKKR